jgi:hypothetical protein
LNLRCSSGLSFFTEAPKHGRTPFLLISATAPERETQSTSCTTDEGPGAKVSCNSALPGTFVAEALTRVACWGQDGPALYRPLGWCSSACLESSALYPATAGAAECRWWWGGLNVGASRCRMASRLSLLLPTSRTRALRNRAGVVKRRAIPVATHAHTTKSQLPEQVGQNATV